MPETIVYNMPPKAKRGIQIAVSQVKTSKKVAKSRIQCHVERIIAVAKKNQILTFQLGDIIMYTDIIRICFFLSNFQNRIVSYAA
eukprot:Pgem_evm1s17464